MSWDDIDNKHKKHVDSYFVSCTEKYEVDYIVKIILEDFPYLNETTIRAAIKECCNAISGNRPRDEFMQCLKGKLGL